MKQIFTMLTVFMLLCTLVACGGAENQNSPDPSQAVPEENLSEGEPASTPDECDPVANEEIHVLVAYFSATGNTENIARHIQTVLNADLSLIHI